MLHIAFYDSEICDEPAEEEGLQGWGGAGGLHPITPSYSAMGLGCAPSLSCISIEVQNGYEISLEKALTASLLTIEDTLASLRPEQPLLRPKGMEMAPYRSMGCGMQVMAERALMCEWSLFHNFRLVGAAMLPPRPLSPVALIRTGASDNPRRHGTPSLHHERRLSRYQVRVDGVSVVGTAPAAAAADGPVEAAHGGYVEASDLNTPVAPAAVEEVICESKPYTLDLSALRSYATPDDERRIHNPWTKTRRKRYSGGKNESSFDVNVERKREKARRRAAKSSPLQAFVDEVADVVARRVWEEAVVPELAPLVPPQGISVVERVRCSTANSSETDCTAKHSLVTSNATQKGPPFLQRPHTGEPRTSSQRYWVPDAPLNQEVHAPSPTAVGHAQIMQFPTVPEDDGFAPDAGRGGGVHSRNGRYQGAMGYDGGGMHMARLQQMSSHGCSELDGGRVAAPEDGATGTEEGHARGAPECETPPLAHHSGRHATSSGKGNHGGDERDATRGVHDELCLRGHAKSPAGILSNITTSCNTKDPTREGEKAAKEKKRGDTRNGKKKDKKNRKNSKTQRPVRLDEYVLEQNRLFQQGLSPYAMDKGLGECDGGGITEECALPPLYPGNSDGVAIVTVSDSFDSYHYLDPDLSAPLPEEEEPHHASVTPTTNMRESPIDGCLPTILSSKPLASTVSGRYDWPVRAQTAIPSHARAIRMQQQYIPSQR